jgi:hypothetical protein
MFSKICQILTENEKHFKQFYLNNTAITELEENTFLEITFNEILIKNAKNLKSINSDAFNSTNLVTKVFEVYNSPVINFPPNFDIFLLLS